MFEKRYFHLNKLLKRYGEIWKNPNEAEFHKAHFINAVGLFKKLQPQREPQREPHSQLSQYLHSKLKKATPDLLSRCKAPNDKESEFRLALVDDFNEILGDPDLYSDWRFRHVRLSGEARRLVKEYQTIAGEPNKRLPHDILRRLNRVLLEEAYPQEISNDLFQINKIQLVNQDGYEYVKDRGNKYFYIQCLLHGAANKLVTGVKKMDTDVKGGGNRATRKIHHRKVHRRARPRVKISGRTLPTMERSFWMSSKIHCMTSW